MAFITVDVDDNILDVAQDDPGGGIALTSDQQDSIKNSKYGHAQFKYVAGDLVPNTVAYDAIELVHAKRRKIDQLKDAQARQAITAKIVLVNNANSMSELNAIN